MTCASSTTTWQPYRKWWISQTTYHIEFRAAKCNVVRIGPGQESKIMLNNTILEEVPKYKYLGKIYNTKGNLEEHLTGLETKTMAATQRILAETGDKEFKGMRMKAIWQCIEATIIPILTYGSEAWNPTKREKNRYKRYSTQPWKWSWTYPREPLQQYYWRNQDSFQSAMK